MSLPSYFNVCQQVGVSVKNGTVYIEITYKYIYKMVISSYKNL